jgi:hypothetical protein
MRLLIDATTAWRREPKRQHEEIVASEVPCTVFHTRATPLDLRFWRKYFASVRVVEIGGDHDTWHNFGGPGLLVAEWKATSKRHIDRKAVEG